MAIVWADFAPLYDMSACKDVSFGEIYIYIYIFLR
jgi:hypothetical protein